MKTRMRIEWRECDLDDIIRFWADRFAPTKGKITHYEFVLDPFARKVVFRLFVEEKS